jgi:RNA polymerase sigma-70 factor (ECF subfamily)
MVSHETRRGIGESTSASLIGLVQQDDPDGWRRLWSLYAPLVRWRCRRHGVIGGDAEDIEQEVFQTLARKIRGFEMRTGPSFRSWLRRITENKLGDHFRRARRPGRAIGGTDAHRTLGRIADPDGEVALQTEEDDSPERRLLVRQALAQVGSDFEPRSMRAVWQVVVEGRNPNDVAIELGLTRNAIYIAKSRILGRLRELLADLGESRFDVDHRADPGSELER